MRPFITPVPDLPVTARPAARPTAVIYCEGNLARIDGKTANGLVRPSERYRDLAVIDSAHAGADAGVALGGNHVGIPAPDALWRNPRELVGMVTDAFPSLLAPFVQEAEIR